ncbi:MAG: hypothetical protein A2056_01155 [Deltaproteobacteria bacterium GWA2_42_85]|nr:MAG: hypothetical protein A2056_01155 [Deltaproteobacteria bacterium GWA2_42_85]OGP27277.1 MAG: hypothetical protein A2067_01075 [Deltaproteobacteria bacterium GWB2_42_7]OGP39785.1 MAG: hypothetical protein A2090_04660 [Deltaproteobacteria bacterium GWD2_42_10]OGP48603.1 MAG: hypothetical protein A2022_11220 [Deltaproteobacteria bacterium GWF2_42_12]OGQ66661.1 MAG: hypothetical protein A3F88_07465 [Deltaproteobacteria bacterium RIFCSPLOWO2_12_FULL_42_16]HAG51277.1 hypothetical protein [Delt
MRVKANNIGIKLRLHQQKIWWLNHVLFFLAIIVLSLLSISDYHKNLLLEKGGIENRQLLFVNPFSDCKGDVGFDTKELVSFKQHMEGFIKEGVKANIIKSSAVYFKDLNNCSWFSINEREKFSPGSLLKVPLLTGYLKKAETDPQLFKKRVQFVRDEEFVDSQYIKPVKEIEIGKTYTIEELLYRAIVYSDNKAARQLFYLDNGTSFFKAFNDILLHHNIKLEQHVSINVRDYAEFFTALYNASYLNRDMANSALKLLAEVDFKKGLVAGIPANVRIAHKFGEWGTGQDVEFHDCGIIYYPQHSYLLCVMAKGENEENLIKNAQDISGLTYQYVEYVVKK